MTDTLDLQDQTSPSAQDHTKQPSSPSPLGIGPAAPHQQSEIRRVSEERTSEEQNLSAAWSDANTVQEEQEDDLTSLDGANGDPRYQRDEQAIAQNGGMASTEDTDMAESDGEEGLDEDMMDKISSSPSIDDGGYLAPPTWPRRVSSLSPNSTPLRHKTTMRRDTSLLSSSSTRSPSPFPSTPQDDSMYATRRPSRGSSPLPRSESSSPFTMSPAHFPLSLQSPYQSRNTSEEHHLQGGYAADGSPTDEPTDEGFYDEIDVASERASTQSTVSQTRRSRSPPFSYDDEIRDIEDAAIAALRIPDDDPLLDNSFDDIPLAAPVKEEHVVNEDSDSPNATAITDELLSRLSGSWETLPDTCDADDASDDISLPDNERFVDSGWGGECLRETEDIDFEFVYALHTFVATVEGQANATKGDTMVLLDDSNSYWWLVRVVKDSTIGERSRS